MPKVTIGTRVDSEAVEELDRIAAALSEQAKGAEVSRSDAARLALARGIKALATELGLSSPSATKKGAKPARKPTP